MNQRSFSLIEIIIVVALIGIISIFSLPKITKSIEKSRYKNALTNIKTIHAALKIHKSRNGTYLPAAGDTDTINSNLNSSIEDASFTYSYIATATTATISATQGTPDYTIVITMNDFDPTCMDGTDTCP